MRKTNWIGESVFWENLSKEVLLVSRWRSPWLTKLRWAWWDAQVIKDFPDDFGVFDGGKDFHFTAASGALADVDIEYPLEKSRPGHSFWLRLGLLI